MSGLAIIVASGIVAPGDRLATALGVAGAAAALGRSVAMLFDGASVAALAADNPGITTVLDLGVGITACQSGLAAAGIDARTLPPRVATGGMVGFLAAHANYQLLIA